MNKIFVTSKQIFDIDSWAQKNWDELNDSPHYPFLMNGCLGLINEKGKINYETSNTSNAVVEFDYNFDDYILFKFGIYTQENENTYNEDIENREMFVEIKCKSTGLDYSTLRYLEEDYKMNRFFDRITYLKDSDEIKMETLEDKIKSYCEYLFYSYFTVNAYFLCYKQELDDLKEREFVYNGKEKTKNKSNKPKGYWKLKHIYYISNYKKIHQSKITKNMLCEAWGVHGHMRHYSNGKVIFIKPYEKGKKRNQGLVDKAYLV